MKASLIAAILKILKKRWRQFQEEVLTAQCDEEVRLQNAAYQVERAERRKLEQAKCPHTREDGTTALVQTHFFSETNKVRHDYAVCQRCQLISEDPALVNIAPIVFPYDVKEPAPLSAADEAAYALPLDELLAVAGGYTL